MDERVLTNVELGPKPPPQPQRPALCVPAGKPNQPGDSPIRGRPKLELAIADHSVLVSHVGNGPVPTVYLPTADLCGGNRLAAAAGGVSDCSRDQERLMVLDRLRFINTSLSTLAGYSDEAIKGMLRGRWSGGNTGNQYNTAWSGWINFIYSQGFRCCFFPRSCVANYLAHVKSVNDASPRPKKTIVSSTRTAISTTYNAAFEVNLLVQGGKVDRHIAPGVLGNVQYYVNLNAQLTTKSDSSFPINGPDYNVAYDYWISKGPNESLPLRSLTNKVIQLGRFKGFRGVDLTCLPAGSEAPVPDKPFREYGNTNFIKIAFHNSKGRKGKDQRANNGFTPTVCIHPLRKDFMIQLLGAARGRLMTERCCWVRALGELRFRLTDITRVYFKDGKPPPQLRAPTGATPTLHKLLTFDHMQVKPGMATGSRSSDELQFLLKGTVNARVKDLHNIQYGADSCGRGKPFSAAYYRHTSAQMYQETGSLEARRARLTQTEPDALFKTTYSKVPAHPDFVRRVRSLDAALLDKLSPDERLHI
jgi:hypothetical protein